MSIHLQSNEELQRVVNQEVQAGVSRDPREVSFNLNTNLIDRPGKISIDVNHAAELLAEKGVKDLLANYPGASESMVEMVRAGIKYTAVAKAGESQNTASEKKERQEQLAKKRAIAEQMAQAEAMPLAEAQLISQPLAEPLANKNAQPLMQGSQLNTQQTKASLAAMKQEMIDQYRRELSEKMALAV